MSERVDVTVIGGGPVGLFASFYAGMRGMTVRVIDSLPELGGQLTALYPEKLVYDMPGFPEVLAKDLAVGLARQGTQFGPELHLEDTAETLERDGDGYVIGTRNGHRLPTRTVVVSAGAGAFSPTKVGVEREAEFEGKGLQYGVRDKAALAGKRVVVLGGGDSALDWCLNLHGVASEITLVHRRDQFRAHEDSVQRVRDLGIPFCLFREVHELHGSDRLERVTLRHTQTKELEDLELDALVVNIGFKAHC